MNLRVDSFDGFRSSDEQTRACVCVVHTQCPRKAAPFFSETGPTASCVWGFRSREGTPAVSVAAGDTSRLRSCFSGRSDHSCCFFSLSHVCVVCVFANTYVSRVHFRRRKSRSLLGHRWCFSRARLTEGLGLCVSVCVSGIIFHSCRLSV